ncbi:hypothetical protein Zmor_006739 [Zophobas morio]|uniref:Uncharacterized protein n=1 Tax=Zophobas morio TaxID=2755281 RepID=A0AA38IVG9_9CUCU|nr:hypothetical protein Zmor_006739 [Zophobas morio]
MQNAVHWSHHVVRTGMREPTNQEVIRIRFQLIAAVTPSIFQHCILLLKGDDMNNLNEIIKVAAPCVIEIESDPQTIYHVVLKRQVVIPSVVTLKDAVSWAFGLYFIMNLEYPDKVSAVLEMMQRFFLKIHPDQGSKSKRVTPTKRKVIGFMNKLN